MFLFVLLQYLQCGTMKTKILLRGGNKYSVPLKYGKILNMGLIGAVKCLQNPHGNIKITLAL